MAFDQNLVPQDLRHVPPSAFNPLPPPTAVSEDTTTRISPQPPPPSVTSTTSSCSSRVSDAFFSNPNPSRPDVVHYSDATAASFSGLGYAPPNLGHPHTLGQTQTQAQPQPQPTMWSSRMPAPLISTTTTSISSSGYAYSPNFVSRAAANATTSASDQASEDGGDDSVSGKKVKFLCSFGGKILPRPSDGMLRYVGGQTRIISVRRDVSFGDLVQKMTDIYAQPVIIKYQLPDEDLDALVSVSCPDDVDNMMEEYDKFLERSGDGSAKLRMFLFSSSDLDASGLVPLGDVQDTSHRYVDAVNGIMDGIGTNITRKESIASAASTQNSDMSGMDNNDAILVGHDVSGPSSAGMFSPHSDFAPSNEDVPRLETSAPHVAVPAVPHIIASSQPEIELERTIPLQVPVQQQAPRYNLQQTGLKFPPPPSPYLGGYVDPRPDASIRAEHQKLPSQMIYANPQMLGAPRPILIQPQFQDNSPTLLTQQYIPGMQMTVAPASSHLSVNPNILQPLPHKVVAVPADQSYNQTYPAHVGGGFGWNQAALQDHGALYEGWMPHQAIPRTTDCYMCQKALPHAHSDTVVQDHKDGLSTAASDTNPIYHSIHVDDIRRFHAVPPHNQGVMGLVGDAQNFYSAPRGNLPVSLPEESPQQHVVSSLQMKQEGFTSDNTSVSGLSYQISESGKNPGVAFAEDVARPSISNVRPVDLRMEHLQISSADMNPSNEQGKSHIDQHDTSLQVQPPALGRETVPNAPKASEMMPSSNAEIPYKYNIHGMESVEAVQAPAAGDSAFISDRNSPSNDTRDDSARFQAIAPSGSETVTPNWGAMMNDSPHSLFSNQDPWDMRHDAPFPPPKPSKIATKKEVLPTRVLLGENQLGHGEQNVVDGVRPIQEQVQTSKGLAEEQIKQQLQATAEGVAAAVVDSSMPSDLDFSSHEIDVSVSDVSHEMEGQTNSENVIQTKLEAMNVKSEETNFGFPLSDGLGRLQIIKNSDLEELRELGSGTFGTVFHGKWRGTDVAIKRINDRCFAGKPSEQERMRDDFWNEAIKLADLHHPNVVAFYGVVLDGPGGSVATVTEYMVNGSLRTALQKNERNLDKRKRLLIAMDVAFGMEYLHSKNIVHFDLKSDNLLVNLRDPHRPICKVGDLGLSKVKCQTLISGGVRGTLPWMAPELLNGSSSLVSEKVDVFSFGIVMWELLTGEEPYADLHYGAIIGGIVSNTLRPPVPANCDSDWRSLMERCWSAEPSERPNFTEIANELRSLAAKVPSKGQTPLTTTRTNT